MSSDAHLTEISLPPTYTRGLRGCLVSPMVGVGVFLLGAALIWLPVYACNWDPYPPGCFPVASAFILFAWIVLGGMMLVIWLLCVIVLLARNAIAIRRYQLTGRRTNANLGVS